MDVKIDKFKLIAGGIGGIEVWRTEPVRKGNIISLDQVHRTRNIQIDKPLRGKIQRLKYFYLLLTRHWMSPFDKYFDQESFEPLPLPKKDQPIPVGQELLKKLWNDTAITGVSVKDDGFVIMGTIESVEGKKIGIATPYITAEDDYVFYSEAYEYILEVGKEINKYLYSNLLPLEDAKEQYMLENNLKELTEEDQEKLTEMLISRFHEKGAIVLMNSDDQVEALEAPDEKSESETVVHEAKNNIAPGMFQDGSEDQDTYNEGSSEEENDGQIIIPENKGKVPNEFSEGTSVNQPGNLEQMERDDEMLIEDKFE